MKERLTLSKREQTRLIVLNQLERKELEIEKGACLLGLSTRQLWRLLASYRREGAAGLVHGNRERAPANAFPVGFKEGIVKLASTKYKGFNHTHLTEKLIECEEVSISRSSLRRILLEKGMRSPKKRQAPRHRSRRERYPREGMLLQTDGSLHHWLEDRGPDLCLIGAIDDATGKVPYALFQEQETSEGYMRMLQVIVLEQGIPLALYHDRHGIFELSENVIPTLDEQLAGKEPKTQVGRLLEELGVESISANSPQAKGRIERLWGTFQDRLSSEFRLAGASTMEEANRVLAWFLPEYNRKFAVLAREPEQAYRPPDKSFKAEEYFCLKYQRVVGTDNVVRFNHQRLQVLPSPTRASFARCPVEVQLRLDGSLAVYYQDKPLATRIAPPEATLLRKSPPIPLKPKVPTTHHSKPTPDHPWRVFGTLRTQPDQAATDKFAEHIY
jgi:hypothetical protein